MARPRLVAADGQELKPRWTSWRPKTWQVGVVLLLAGAAGWVALIVLSPYRTLIIGGTAFFLLASGWRVLTDRIAGAGEPVQTVKHIHVKRLW